MSVLNDENLLVTNHSYNENSSSSKVLREEIVEEDKLVKWLYNIVILIGGTGFLFVGVSSYLQYNIIYFLNSAQIAFFPQGLTMCFYGVCAIIVSINQIRIMMNNIGEGFNEFNKEKGLFQLYRKGFRGKHSDVNITLPLTDIVFSFCVQ